MSASWMADPEIMDLEEDNLWDMINQHRCNIVKRVYPERLTPYLRQTNVIDEVDEEDVLHSSKFSTRPMRQGYLLDLLRTRGKNGALAFLDSLLLVYPRIYTQITGKEPTIDPNSFSKLIDSSQLNVFLLNSMSSLHEELTKEKQMKEILLHHMRKMHDKVKRLEEERGSLHNVEAENHRLRKEMDEQGQALSKLKDMQYNLSMSYSVALQEKDSMQSKNNELQEQLFAMKEELHRVRMELQAAQTLQCEEELTTLRKENQKLKENLKLKGQGKLVSLDSIPQSDLTLESAQELLNQLRGKISSFTALEKLWQKEKDEMMKETCNLQTNYEIINKNADAFHNQVTELQKERDQAYAARDTVQSEISSFLAEKDSLRQQVINLTDVNSKLRLQIRSLEEQLQTHRIRRNCMDSEQRDQCLQFKHQRLVRSDAICLSEESDRVSNCSISESWSMRSNDSSSVLRDALQRSCSIPIQEDYPSGFPKSGSNDLPDLLQCEKTDTDSENEMDYRKDLQMFSNLDINDSGSEIGLSRPRRRPALRTSTRTTIMAFQGDDLLKQISIVGGNKTGIFIHQVTKDSAADEMSLIPGCQIMAVDFDVMNPSHKVDMEGMTSEDAHSTLNRVNGFCCLSIRNNLDEYRKLLSDIETGSAVSGDSFYVRVNQSLQGSTGDRLQVTCGDILHIKDTMFKGRSLWYGYRVNPYTMKDGESGKLPNYRRAQEHLITSIQHITWQNTAHRKLRKQVRIVSTDRCTSHLLWTSLDCGSCLCEDSSTGSTPSRSCSTLMPYVLVTPVKVTSKRPVLFVPSLLGRILSEKLCASKDFMKCDSECLTDPEYTAKFQRGDILGEKEGERIRCFFTRRTVESVVEQNAHCLLDLGLSCLSALNRMGIYPIVLHIPMTEKSVKKLKKPLHWWKNCEDLLLECVQREETELDGLPCFYRTVDPESWNDMESLLNSIKHVIKDEQSRVVWLENKPH